MTANEKASIQAMLNNFKLDKLEGKPQNDWQKGYNQGAITILETLLILEEQHEKATLKDNN